MPISAPSSASLNAFKSLSNVPDVAEWLNVSVKRLSFHLYHPRRPRYRRFTLKKAHGGVRFIDAPPSVVLRWQRQLLSCISATVVPKNPAHGFVARRSVVSNAAPHVDSQVILNIDLEGFFPTINFGRVRGMFQNRPFDFPSAVATVLAQLCCENGVLPQGAPTSPAISNAICRGLDRDIEKLSRKARCRYTRYADDLTFSAKKETLGPILVESGEAVPGEPIVLGGELLALVDKHGFKVNALKTRVRHSNQRQEVTGLVVNSRVNVPRQFVRNIRATLHNWKTNGLVSAQAEFEGTHDEKQRRGKPPQLEAHLRGRLDYLRMVRGNGDRLYARYAIELDRLSHASNGASLTGSSALDTTLCEAAVWLVFGRDSSGADVAQGTAFYLRGVGVVTARHVVDAAGVAAWTLVDLTNSSKAPVPITGYKSSSGVDIAVLETTAEFHASLGASAVSAKAGDTVTLAGFPNWLSGQRLQVSATQVYQLTMAAKVNHIITHAMIREGNSGGPMLNASGEVVGVIVAGSAGSMPNSAVDISHAQQAAGGSRVSLP